jgi:hypothetical protein
MKLIHKTGILLLAVIAIIILSTLVLYPTAPIKPIQDDEQIIRTLVTDFGQKIKNVSLADGVQVKSQIIENYEKYFSSELLVNWMSDPALALGQSPSVPILSGIKINSIEKKSDTLYDVYGDIIQMNYEGGGINEIPVEEVGQSIVLAVEKINDQWHITKISTGPVNGVGDNWKLSQPSAQGIQFMYPDPLSTKFITTQDWPPTVQMTSGEYVCKKGNTKDNTGIVTEHSVGDRKYCVTTFSEGAAGSTYMTYEYMNKQGDFLAHVKFTLRYVQCANYDEPDQATCKVEQTGFSVDGLVDRITSSIRML